MRDINQPPITNHPSPVTGVSEFDLIARYFTRATPQAVLGVGDDAALVAVGSGMELAISTDTLVEGTHFFADADPRLLGWKALAVNVSDLAAMGAEPRFATLAISLPQVQEPWLARFSEGFFECARQYGVDLIGGDTTKGPLCITITVLGETPKTAALRRSGARINEDIWISGQLGNAALGLAALQGKITKEGLESCITALHAPQPRVELGLALRNRASAAIDVSDGLMADLGHILERSGVGADIRFDLIPRSTLLAARMDNDLGRFCLLAGGEDYELCFTAPPRMEPQLLEVADKLKIRLTRIGKISAEKGLRLLDGHGKPMVVNFTGYDHFA